ncbi:MAG: hypothetical protein VX610_07430 [SAR324 cluster bacterium]|nr:hypothetical protein [SAR324 cluster bacterium]
MTFRLFAIVGLLLFVVGCTTQGRRTALTFERSFFYEELYASMEQLKYYGYGESVQQGMSAVKTARWVSKHDAEPGKRELAVRALVFLTFSSDDGDVRDRSESRLEAILEDGWPLYLQMAVVDGIIDLANGSNGFPEEYDEIITNFGVVNSEREDALEFLLNRFDELPPELQYHAAGGLHRFLRQPVSLESCPYDLCDIDVRVDVETWEKGKEVQPVIPTNADPNAVAAGAYGKPEWKPIAEKLDWQEELDDLKFFVWESLDGILEDTEDVPLLVRQRLARFAGEIEQFSLDEEMAQSFKDRVEAWIPNESISVEVRDLVRDGRERVSTYGAKQNTPAKFNKTQLHELSQRDTGFLEIHLAAILKSQHNRQRSGLRAGPPNLSALAFSGFDDSATGLIRHEVIWRTLADALKAGLVIEGSGTDLKALQILRQVEERTKVAEDAQPTEAHFAARMALHPLMELIGKLYPSLERRRQNPKPLLEELGEGAAQASRIADQRRYLEALAAGSGTFPEDTYTVSEGLNMEMDLIIRHRLTTAMQL